MTETIAIVLPPGPDSAAAAHFVRCLAPLSARFRPVVFGPPVLGHLGQDALAEVTHRTIPASRLPGDKARRYAARAAALVAALSPTLIEVHDSPEIANLLGARFRPTPVLLILHTDPQSHRDAQDAAARTFLLAQATRIAALDPAHRARLLEGVHPSMRACALLPPPDGPLGAQGTAAALDTLRLDALRAWSRPLHGTI